MINTALITIQEGFLAGVECFSFVAGFVAVPIALASIAWTLVLMIMLGNKNR